MNHKLSAKLHKLPFCPECFARRLRACVNPNGTTRAPHRVRQLIVDGLVTVRRSRKWKVLIAATEANDQLVKAIDQRSKGNR